MITSSSNEKIKWVVQLNNRSKARRESGCFAAEGYKLFCETPESLRRAVFITETFANAHPEIARRDDTEIVAEHIFGKMCDTRTPQGILTVAAMPVWSRDSLLGSGRTPLIMVLENVQDPGNVGTIIRTAEGAGVTGIFISRDTADVFSPKVIRATMGSVFRVPLIQEESLTDVLTWLSARGISTCAAHLDGSVVYTEPDYTAGTAFLIGNEGNGLTDELAAAADLRIRIPMDGQVESLNASVAAAVMMYEASRQRRRAGVPAE